MMTSNRIRLKVSLDYEGREDARTAIPQSLTLLHKVFSA